MDTVSYSRLATHFSHLIEGIGGELRTVAPTPSRLRRPFVDGVSKRRHTLFLHSPRHPGKQRENYLQSRVSRRPPTGGRSNMLYSLTIYLRASILNAS